MHYRGSLFFPLTLLALTIVLVIVMVRVMHPASTQEAIAEYTIATEEFEEVTEEEYQENLHRVMEGFSDAYMRSDTAIDKIAIVDRALEHVLEIRVPGTYKELHFSVAFQLNRVKESLWEDNEEFVYSEEQELFSLLLEHSWIDSTIAL